MVNWKDIHSNFTPWLQKEWEDKGFNYEECKEWIDIPLDIGDSDFAFWLKKEGYKPNDFLNNENIGQLRSKHRWDFAANDARYFSKVYPQDNNWNHIHPGFSKKDITGNKIYQLEWEERGFTSEEAEEWIKVGFKPDNYWNVQKWKEFKFTPQQAKEWISIGLKRGGWGETEDFELASYLKSKDLSLLEAKKN